MPAEFYDQFIDRHLIPLEKSPWRKVYEEAARLLPESKDETIVDIGCGTGRFAKLLYDKGYRKYLGIDFSKGMLEEAKRYNPSFTSSKEMYMTRRSSGCCKNIMFLFCWKC